MTHVLAVIPARGGSKGIHRKNLVPVQGVPLVVRSIQHAQAAACVTRVVVSTEDPEIAEVARRAGAEVPFLRPVELAGDLVLDLPVFEHVLTGLEATGYRPDVVVHLRPTAPIRKAGWIDGCVDLLLGNPRADAVRSVHPVTEHPWRVFEEDAQGFLVPLMRHVHPAPHLLRRQDLPVLWFYNCVVDVTRPSTILQKKSMIGDLLLPFKMNAEDVVDIDTPRDLTIARALLENP